MCAQRVTSLARKIFANLQGLIVVLLQAHSFVTSFRYPIISREKIEMANFGGKSIFVAALYNPTVFGANLGVANTGRPAQKAIAGPALHGSVIQLQNQTRG